MTSYSKIILYVTTIFLYATEASAALREQQPICAAACYGVIADPAKSDVKRGKLQELIPYIGTYQYEAVLKNEDVRKSLERLVKSENVSLIKTNLNVFHPIDFVSGNLILMGNAPHQGMEEAAIVAINIHDGEISAVIVHEKKIILYANSARYSDLPYPIREFIAYQISGDETHAVQPDSITWNGKK